MNEWKACHCLACSRSAPCGLAAGCPLLPPRVLSACTGRCTLMHTPHTLGVGGNPKSKTSWHFSQNTTFTSFSFCPLLTCKQSTHPLWNIAGEHPVSEVLQASDCFLLVCMFSDMWLKRTDRKSLPAADWVDRSLPYPLENVSFRVHIVWRYFPSWQF